MFIAALFIITKKWEQPKSSSTNEWINNVVDSYKGLKIKRIIINSCGFWKSFYLLTTRSINPWGCANHWRSVWIVSSWLKGAAGDPLAGVHLCCCQKPSKPLFYAVKKWGCSKKAKADGRGAANSSRRWSGLAALEGDSGALVIVASPSLDTSLPWLNPFLTLKTASPRPHRPLVVVPGTTTRTGTGLVAATARRAHDGRATPFLASAKTSPVGLQSCFPPGVGLAD